VGYTRLETEDSVLLGCCIMCGVVFQMNIVPDKGTMFICSVGCGVLESFLLWLNNPWR